MNVVERVLEKKASYNSLLMKCNLALCLRGTVDSVLILRMQEEYYAK